MIKISIDQPQLPDGGPLEHSGTSWQISRIPDFTDRTFYISESLNDSVNLLTYRHSADIDHNESVYCRVRYHFNNNDVSSWSRVIPVKGDQVGLKMSGTVVITPKVRVNITYNGDKFNNLILETNEMSLYSGVGDHESTTWSIIDSDNNVVWSRVNEKRDKTKIEIDSNFLESGKIYIVKAIHHTTTNVDSNSGKALLSTNINDNEIYKLEPMGKLVPGRLLYYKLFVYLNSYISIDLIIRDAQGVIVASNLDQLTRTPRIHADGLIPYQRYTIYSRIKYANDKYSNYVEVSSHVVEHNELVIKSDTIEYLDKYNFTQELRLGGETVAATNELYNGDIFLPKANDNSIYRHVMCEGRLIDKGPVLTLDGMSELMDKPYINIVPLHSGRILIDYNAVRILHMDDPTVSNSIRNYMNLNKLDSVDDGLVTIVRNNNNIGKLTNDIFGSDLVHRPRFSLYDYNTATKEFKLLNTIVRDDELIGTAVNNSLVVMEDDSVYYLPAHSVDGVDDIDKLPHRNIKLKKLNLEDFTISTVTELPIGVKSYPTLFSVENNKLIFMGGSNEPTLVNNIVEYDRTNHNIYEYDIYLDDWDYIASTTVAIPTPIYAIASYVRRDGMVVLFNNVNSGVSRGNQRSYIYNPSTKDITVSDNDTRDNLTYRNSVRLLNGDIVRISTRVIDPQLVHIYVSDTYTIDQLHTDDTLDVVTDLVVPVGETVTVESLYKFSSITIEGDSDVNTGRLILLDGNSSTEFKWNDLIVIGDTEIEQNIYSGDAPIYNSITILDGSSLEVYNTLRVPTNTTHVADSPVSFKELSVADNSELIITIP